MSEWQTAEPKKPRAAKAQNEKPLGQRSNNRRDNNKGVKAQVNSSQSNSKKVNSTNNNPNSFANLMNKNQLPKGGFSTSKGTVGQATPVTIKEVPIEHAYVDKDLTRSYELTRAPPKGFESVLKKTFPSLDVCMVNSIEIKGKILPSLYLHFADNHKNSFEDHSRAANINISVSGIAIRLTAAASEKTDEDGVLIPRVSKSVYATGMPFSLARNYNAMYSVLSEYIVFDQEDSIKLIYEDGMFKGNVVIPVAEFKRMPPATVLFPFYTMGANREYERVPNATCKVGIACKGYDSSSWNN